MAEVIILRSWWWEQVLDPSDGASEHESYRPWIVSIIRIEVSLQCLGCSSHDEGFRLMNN